LLQQFDGLFAATEIEQRFVAVERAQADEGIVRERRELQPKRSSFDYLGDC
jgi:hypothetical protein